MKWWWIKPLLPKLKERSMPSIGTFSRLNHHKYIFKHSFCIFFKY